MTFDPDTAPDPAWWRSLDEGTRIELAEAAHDDVDDALHADLRAPRVHHVLHALVETHVALGEPAVTGETLARLTDEGVRRHAAVHMVAEVLLHALATGTIADPDAWADRLRTLDAADWIGSRLAMHARDAD